MHTKLPPSICVAIPTYQRGEFLVSALKNLLQQSPPPNEILVIDQTPEYPQDVETYLESVTRAGRVRRVRQTTPSLPMARNRAIAESTSEILVFIDEDVELPQGFVGAHRAAYAEETIHAVCGQVYQSRDGAKPDWFRKACADPAYRNSQKVFAYRPGQNAQTFRGCNFSVRRSAVLQVGGVDESFSYASALGEDEDLAFRLVAAGKRIAFAPSAWLVHLKAPSGGVRINNKIPEWTRSTTGLIMLFRYGTTGAQDKDRRVSFLLSLWSVLRRGPLRRANIVRPWRQPWALASLVYSAGVALKATALGPRSSIDLSPDGGTHTGWPAARS